MKLNYVMTALLAAPVLGFAGGALAQPISKDAKDMAIKNAEARYKADKTACDAFSGNAKDICIAEAKGRESISKADAEARYENTPKSRELARVAPAEAAFSVAKERCDDSSGNAKDVCLKEATAAHVRALADAKVIRVTSETRNDNADKATMAKQSANSEKRAADYNVAAEKCDSLDGTAKDGCIRDAKVKYDQK